MTRDADDEVSGIQTVVRVGAILLIGAFLMGALGGSVSGGIEDRVRHPSITTGTYQSFEHTDNTIKTIYNVRDTRGYAINLTGADNSYVQSNADLDIATDQTWTVSTWAAVHPDATQQSMAAVSVDGRVILKYNGTEGNWTAYYYDDSSTSSDEVTVNATSPTAMTHLAVVADGSTLTIYRNNTQGTTADLTDDSQVSGSLDADNWHGTLEETRTFDDPLTSTSRQQLIDDPVGPLADTNRTARLMYDEGSGTSTAIFWAGTDATVSNAEWTQRGFDGQDVLEGTDYELDVEDGRVKALAGGRLDGAPTVWIDYRVGAYPVRNSIMDTVSSAVSLGGLLPIVIIATLLLKGLGMFEPGGGGRR